MASTQAMPALAMSNLPQGGSGARGPPTPHKLSGRRLSKSVMRADSQDVINSKSWGMVELRDGSGTARSTRVMQNEVVEDINMVKVTWFWSFDGVTHEVELRHGRRSGIRKIYVNKVMVDRIKSLKNWVSDTGSRHEFAVSRLQAEIIIVPKGVQGFHYQLKIDGQDIEQSVQGPAGEGPLDIGTRALTLPKTSEGLGMTLRNNPFKTGVVVWTLEEGKAAARTGLQIGDVVLSMEDEILDSIEPLVDIVQRASGVINMEVAGTAPSRTVSVVKNKDKNFGISMQVTACGVGILVSEIDPQGCAASSNLKVGDSILSVMDQVASSPKHAKELINNAEYVVKFVVVGEEIKKA